MRDPVELEAEELLLRPWRVQDAAQIATVAGDPQLTVWNPVIGSAAEFVARRGDWSDGRHVSWAITDENKPATVLGSVSLHRIDDEQRDCEVGYWTMPSHRGRGLATRAVLAAAGYGFVSLHLNRIYLFHALDNPASCQVAQRAGFRLEGVHRRSHRYGDGLWYDEHSHARLAGDRGDRP